MHEKKYISLVLGENIRHVEIKVPPGIVVDENNEIIVEKGFYALCGLHYWNVILTKAKKAKFKFVKNVSFPML